MRSQERTTMSTEASSSTSSPALTTSSTSFRSAPSTQPLNPRSCVTCRRRKVRCDKISPCSNCQKAHVQCDFPPPGRAPRRPKNGLSARGASEREAELLKRLRRLEGVVEELSGQVDIGASEDGNQAPASPRDSVPIKSTTEKSGGRARTGEGVKMPRVSVPLESQTAREFGRLVIDEGQGRSRYVSNTFWASLSKEVDDIQGILTDGLSEDSDNASPESALASAVDNQNHQSFILGYSSSNVNLRPLHPLPSQIPFYWQVYIENVDPIVKIMHKPTMEKTIKESKDNLDTLGSGTEALMFSLYFAVITSMTTDEVQANFGVEKNFLLSRYRFAVEQALARAHFLNTSEMVTVQAFVLFLVCVRRHDDSRFVWTLTGLAIRISQSLGLHRDGTIFGLSPFDTEMRRRLWWQVCILDLRASEDHGTDPSILEPSFDTKLPLNVDDCMLDPAATEPPEPKVGVSEMSFCLVRYEICGVGRRLAYTPPGSSFCRDRSQGMTLAEKEKIVQDCHERMESKYLQYFTDAGPLYWVAATVSRLIIAKMGLVIYHPLHNDAGIRNEIPPSTLERLFIASIEIIEYSRLLETEASTKKWGWLFHTYVQWHAIAYLLGELCIRDHDDTVERAWMVLDRVFKDWGNALRHSNNGMLWMPIRKLMARARRKREIDLARKEALLASEISGGVEKEDEGNPFLASEITGSQEYRNLYTANQQQQQQHQMPVVKRDNWDNGGVGAGFVDHGKAGSLMAEERGQPLQEHSQATHTQLPFQNGMAIPATTTTTTYSPDFQMELDALGDMDVSWQGWDDMVREFQMEGVALPETWW